MKDKKNKKMVNVMIGYGDNSFIMKVPKGTKVMTRYGNVIEAGLTKEEEQERLNKKIEELIEDKPKRLFKKR